MKGIYIIGIGSPYGADQSGWHAIEFLKADRKFRDLFNGEIQLICLDRPGMALLEYLQDVNYAILIDAIAGGEPGKILEVTKEEILCDTRKISSHFTGVAEALAMGDIVDCLPNKITIYGIGTGDCFAGFTADKGNYSHLKKLIVNQLTANYYL